MAHNSNSANLEGMIRKWMDGNKKEGSRLEFKLRIELKTPGAKAEFIRDVISLANSEGEWPREAAYLVVGFRDGERYDVRQEQYDGARFSQLLNSYVCPPVPLTYEEFGNAESERFGVLIIRPDSNSMYLVNKELRHNNERLLAPGQSWGRNAGGKMELNGEDIVKRFAEVTELRIIDEREPLEERIASLEKHSGPALDVKRIRFEIESCLADGDWNAVLKSLERLLPYAREFDDSIKHQVLDAVYSATANMGDMPLGVASVIGSLWKEVMPIWAGGMHHRSWRTYSVDDQELLERIEEQVFSMLWETCRRYRKLEILKIAMRVYWLLIRVAGLNDLQRLYPKFLLRARNCMAKCKEKNLTGTTFLEGYKVLEFEISDACDFSESSGVVRSV